METTISQYDLFTNADGYGIACPVCYVANETYIIQRTGSETFSEELQLDLEQSKYSRLDGNWLETGIFGCLECGCSFTPAHAHLMLPGYFVKGSRGHYPDDLSDVTGTPLTADVLRHFGYEPR